MSQYSSLGAGWNTFEQRTRNGVVDIQRRDLHPNVECTIYKCETSEDINDKLEISGSLGIDSPLAQFDAKARFAKELTKKTNAITILIKAKRTWSAEVATAKFKENFDNASKLFAQAGDSYIDFVEVGAEYYAAYQFTSESMEQRRNITAEAEGTFGRGTKVKASLKAEMDNMAGKTKSAYTFTQKLFGVALQLPEHEDIAKFALELVGKDIPNPELLKARTASYSGLKGCPDGFEQIDKWVEAYSKPIWYQFSVKAIERRAQLITVRLQAVQDLYAFYGASKVDPKLGQNAEKLQAIQDAIRDWKQKFNGGKSQVEKLNLDLTCFEIPSPNFLLKPGQWFNGRPEGGNAFTDFDRELIYSFVYPKTFKGTGAGTLDSMTTVYACRSAMEPNNERLESTFERTHGGKGGIGLNFGAFFSPNEIWWTGCWLNNGSDPRWRDTVCSFEVKRRPEQDKHHKLGNGLGPFKGDFVPEGCSFVGFQGRAGDAIDALQPVYVEFKQAYWDPVRPH